MQEAVLRKYQELIECDRKLCSTSQKLFNSIYGTVLQSCNKRLTGSTKDGTAVSRWFKKTYGNVKSHIEWDIEYDSLELEQESYVIQEISNYPGYVRVYERNGDAEYGQHIDGEVCRKNLFYVWKRIVKEEKHEIKKEFYDIFQEKSHIAEDFLYGKEHYFFKTFPWTKPKVNLKMEGLSVLLEITDEEKGICFSCDNIAAIYCKDFWPKCAKDWSQSNDSNWTKEEFDDLKKTGCSIVPKPSRHSERSWRLSLSEVESKVMKRFTEQQYLAFFICKILYYKHLAHLRDGDSEIRSYAFKNAALSCFGGLSHKPTSKDYFEGVFQLTMHLLDYVRQALKPKLKDGMKPYMEHFMLKDVNILLNVTSSLGLEAAIVLQGIIDGNILAYLPKENEIDEVISMVNDMEKRVNNQHYVERSHRKILRQKFRSKSESTFFDEQNSAKLHSFVTLEEQGQKISRIQPARSDSNQSLDSGYSESMNGDDCDDNDSLTDYDSDDDPFSEHSDLCSDSIYSDLDQDSDYSDSFSESDGSYSTDSSNDDLSSESERLYKDSFNSSDCSYCTTDLYYSDPYTDGSEDSDLDMSSLGERKDTSSSDSHNTNVSFQESDLKEKSPSNTNYGEPRNSLEGKKRWKNIFLCCTDTSTDIN